MTATPILARRQLRLAMLAALRSIPGVTVLSPGDWAAPPVRLPEIRLRCSDERKQAVAKAAPDFETTVVLEIQARVVGATAEDAQDAIEALGQKIEVAVLTAGDLIRLTSRVADIHSRTEINATGERHIGAVDITVGLEVFEAFDPAELVTATFPALLGATVHVDCIEPFDARGTYADAPFPDSVNPAVRAAGPDGRDEAIVDINLNP